MARLGGQGHGASGLAVCYIQSDCNHHDRMTINSIYEKTMYSRTIIHTLVAARSCSCSRMELASALSWASSCDASSRLWLKLLGQCTCKAVIDIGSLDKAEKPRRDAWAGAVRNRTNLVHSCLTASLSLTARSRSCVSLSTICVRFRTLSASSAARACSDTFSVIWATCELCDDEISCSSDPTRTS